ncbi:MAG TPA: hypothetical protein DEP11_04890 [Candidatus Jacksonbacteria bacterium]|nr:hypothetical protein [Candidatus Jacksonbacteria bacterium]
MVKFVADIGKGVLALGGEMHADCEEMLLQADSKQEDLWGANLYPNNTLEERIEYLSLINIRPHQDNREMYIQDPHIRLQIKAIAEKLLLSPDDQMA